MAELKVINRVKELEGELTGMGLVDNATAFLTTSGMLITIVAVSHKLTIFRDGNAYNRYRQIMSTTD